MYPVLSNHHVDILYIAVHKLLFTPKVRSCQSSFNLVSVLGMLKKHMHSRTQRRKRGDLPTQCPTLSFPLIPTSIPIQRAHNPIYRVPVRLSDIGPAGATARQAGSDFCGNMIHASVAVKEIQMPRSPTAQNKNMDCFIGQNSREMFGNLRSGRSYPLNRRIGAIETNLL
jgi:hypothetical protein